MDDELIDVINEKGELTGNVVPKCQAHKEGLLHASVHVWICDDRDRVLLQKRASGKPIYPNLWDVSVAGHLSTGDTPIEAAVREVFEEVGLTIDVSQLKLIQKRLSRKQPTADILDNELHYIFLCNIGEAPLELVLQSEEVEEVSWVNFVDFSKTITSDYDKYFVPHGIDYYDTISSFLINIP